LFNSECFRQPTISPLIFTYKFGERRIAIRILTKRVTPNLFGPVCPIDTSVRQQTNRSIGTGPSGFLQQSKGAEQTKEDASINQATESEKHKQAEQDYGTATNSHATLTSRVTRMRPTHPRWGHWQMQIPQLPNNSCAAQSTRRFGTHPQPTNLDNSLKNSKMAEWKEQTPYSSYARTKSQKTHSKMWHMEVLAVTWNQTKRNTSNQVTAGGDRKLPQRCRNTNSNSDMMLVISFSNSIISKKKARDVSCWSWKILP
jgi:hypothetical protein